jgi:uncharacterized BrkB/YihY/UPF0761 family membrane protein
MQKSLIAGILSIVSGVLGLLAGLCALIAATIFNSVLSESAFQVEPFPEDFFAVITSIYIGFAIFFFITGVLSIVGGIFACQRKSWGLALAGAIAATLSFMPTGIASVVFLALGKSEFDQPAAPLK